MNPLPDLSRPALLAAIVAAPLASAFPPAPHYTVYGIVRDQIGQAITADSPVLILLKDGEEIGRAPIRSSLRLDQNYQIPIRIDQNRSGTTLYSDKALPPHGSFSLVVEMNGSRFYPIEVDGNLTAGTAGERVRLDLNLGEDTDDDGLPDVWEAWQLYQARLPADENGNWDLALIDRQGDLDGDGTNNYLEYLAGTFAGDATERFTLTIKEKLESSIRLEFYAITGKTYTIESSHDGKTWSRVDFAVGDPANGSPSYTATGVGVLSAYLRSGPGHEKYYRLTVR